MGKADDVFAAEDEGPPTRRFWIARDPSSSRNDVVRGWSFIFDELVDGGWRPGRDAWEEHFFEIMRYPPEYQSKPLIWRRESDDAVVDLEELRRSYD